MLHVYRSNRVEVLVEILADLLASPGQRLADPFAPLRVVVGSRGMERWLRHQLAVKLSGAICANVEFPFPGQVLDEALDRLEGDRGQERDPWRPDSLAWAILEVLPALLQSSDPALAPLDGYLATQGVVSSRDWGLARQLADVFDRYVNYRPELAIAWSEGRATWPQASDAGPLGWQPLLWRAVQDHIGAPHGATRARDAFARLPAAPVFDQPLRIFGISSLPPAMLRRISELSRVQDVELYVVCPSDQYWADLGKALPAAGVDPATTDRDRLGELLREQGGASAGHPLLQSLGRVDRDLQIALEALGDRLVDKTGRDMFVDPAAVAPTALSWLQSDVLRLRDPVALDPQVREARAPALDDNSIQLHACFGPTRQVEVLRDALLHLFAADPALEPRDVLVVTPDIESYAPLVSAVFDQGRDVADPDQDGAWGPTGAPRIPFAIADRSVRRVNPVADVLLRVLALAVPHARITASAVVDLFGVEPFRHRFGITTDDLPAIEGWVRETGVRWGRDADDRQAHGQPAVDQNTWIFGLQRLALGAVMADDAARLFEPGGPPGVVPHDSVEGGVTWLLGRLMDAVATLFDEIEALAAPRPVAEWLARLLGDPSAPPGSAEALGTLGRLTSTPGAARWLEERVRTALTELGDEARDGRNSRDMDVQALLAALEQRFEVASGAVHEQTGAVTFAAMTPYRTVPYRVVALLGMDEGAFPRNPGRLRFDLTHRHPRVGDRDARDEDRHLLLEALLSARSHLLVFYTGADVRSGEERAPAVPIGELRDVVDATLPGRDGRSASAILTRHHPLQAFSPQAFQPPAPWSFDRRLLDAARRASGVRTAPPSFFASGPAALPAGEEVETITLDQLAWFFRDPTKALLSRALRLWLDDRAETLEDREPVELDGLGRWAVADALLRAHLAGRAGGAGMDVAVRRLRAEGVLPLGSGGEAWLQAPKALVEQIMGVAAPWVGTDDAPLPWDEPLQIAVRLDPPGGPASVTATLAQRRERDVLHIGVGDVGKPKYVVKPWLQALAWAAVDGSEPVSTVVVLGRLKQNGEPEVKPTRFVFGPGLGAGERRAAARDLLGALVDLYRQGLAAPLPFFPQSSHAFAWALRLGRKAPHNAKEVSVGELEPPYDERVAKALRYGLEKALDCWEDGFETTGEGSQPHIARVFGGACPLVGEQGSESPVDLRFARIALAFWFPLFGAQTEDLSPLGAAAGGGT